MPNVVETPQSICRFGLARGDVTPPVGIYNRMWGAAAHDRATGVHRPLTATAFLIGPGDPTADLIVVALDHCVLFQGPAAALPGAVAARAGLDCERLLIACSHTHSVGLMDSSRAELPGGDLIAPYLDQLTERLAGLATEARSRARPATLCYGSGRCGLATNRDYLDESGGRPVVGFNPDGFADDTVLVVRVHDADGGLLATIVNYACHPTTLAWQNTLISPDFPGAMRELVERETGVPCIFLQGASGDLGPREGFVGDVAVADRNGRQLGFAVLSALEGLPPPRTRFEYAGVVESGTAIGTWRHAPLDAARLDAVARWRCRDWAVELPYRPDLPTIEGAREARTRWEERQAALVRGDRDRAADCRAFIERMDRQLSRISGLPPGPTYPLGVHLWRAGDAVWLAVEAEHYQHLQVELRRRFPGTPVVVMTLVNGTRPAYLPTASTYGQGNYPAQIAMLAAGCLEQLTDAVAAQIAAWSADGPEPAPCAEFRGS
jgi:hypothetical protein